MRQGLKLSKLKVTYSTNYEDVKQICEATVKLLNVPGLMLGECSSLGRGSWFRHWGLVHWVI